MSIKEIIENEFMKREADVIWRNYLTAHILVIRKVRLPARRSWLGGAKHNMRKYHSSDYSKENIRLVYGTDNMMQDVKQVYREQFSEALKEYNEKQTRPERKIKNYFNYVSERQQDMAVEIIFQIGDKEFFGGK